MAAGEPVGETAPFAYQLAANLIPQIRPTFGQPIFYMVPFFIIEWLGRRQEFPLERMPFPAAVRWLIYWLLTVGISVCGLDRDMQFIYFQF